MNDKTTRCTKRGDATRFWERVIRGQDAECWLWTGHIDHDGYGRLRVGDGKRKRAHRYAYELTHGEEVAGELLVCHSCDNPVCVNPNHLHLGTSPSNTGERQARGRSARGERQGLAKLTDAAVQEIRSSKESRADLARRFCVSETAIAAVISRRTWGHLP